MAHSVFKFADVVSMVVKQRGAAAQQTADHDASQPPADDALKGEALRHLVAVANFRRCELFSVVSLPRVIQLLTIRGESRHRAPSHSGSQGKHVLGASGPSRVERFEGSALVDLHDDGAARRVVPTDAKDHGRFLCRESADILAHVLVFYTAQVLWFAVCLAMYVNSVLAEQNGNTNALTAWLRDWWVGTVAGLSTVLKRDLPCHTRWARFVLTASSRQDSACFHWCCWPPSRSGALRAW